MKKCILMTSLAFLPPTAFAETMTCAPTGEGSPIALTGLLVDLGHDVTMAAPDAHGPGMTLLASKELAQAPRAEGVPGVTPTTDPMADVAHRSCDENNYGGIKVSTDPMAGVVHKSCAETGGATDASQLIDGGNMTGCVETDQDAEAIDCGTVTSA